MLLFYSEVNERVITQTLVMGSEQNRFPQPERERRKRWGGCWGALSCFGAQKGGTRIVPASRIPEGNASVAQPNGHQAAGLTNPGTAFVPSLLAPPSSPASFSNSALPSTAQSPNCFLSLSANSPGGPSSSMYATGPYAHETQLVSPPVFSTFTTEPSTAPLTPPPELAHLTTPSSPDVPYARFLSSSADLRNREKTNYITTNDLQATYSLYPGSPHSGLVSPMSRASNECSPSPFPEQEFSPQWDSSLSPQNGKSPRSGFKRLPGQDAIADASVASKDSNFFCPATFAQFYLDNPPFPHTAGRLSVSKDSDAYSNGGNGHQNRQNRSSVQDMEEIEAYRASFGFSADEIVTTAQYVEIADVNDDSFTIQPFSSSNFPMEESTEPAFGGGLKALKTKTTLRSQNSIKSESDIADGRHSDIPTLSNGYEDHKSGWQPGNVSGSSTPENRIMSDDEHIFTKSGSSKMSRKYEFGSSCSDAEIDYRRGRSLREGKENCVWHN